MAPAHGSGGGKGGFDRNERVEREREKLDLISISIERNGAYTLEIWCIVQCHRVSPPFLLQMGQAMAVCHIYLHTHTHINRMHKQNGLLFLLFSSSSCAVHIVAVVVIMQLMLFPSEICSPRCNLMLHSQFYEYSRTVLASLVWHVAAIHFSPKRKRKKTTASREQMMI